MGVRRTPCDIRATRLMLRYTAKEIIALLYLRLADTILYSLSLTKSNRRIHK